jgi:ribonuclease HII
VAKAANEIDWWLEERAALARGFRTIAGIDEAGRGPLAGPVVAACVILPFGEPLPGVHDSKKLTPLQRDKAFDLIQERAVAVGVGIADHATIDKLNILRATHHAMRCAAAELSSRPEFVLIDGLPVQPFPILQKALVKGDSRSLSIAAASIIAKVTRDRLMVEYDALYPEYGFAAHKGYSAPLHLEKLEKHGPCPIHRRSFAPVARHFSDQTVELENDGTGQTALSFTAEPEPDTGESGERIAAAHLARLGMQILCSRYRCREGEIDIVARQEDIIVFVEVKARRRRFGSPAEAVDNRKRKRLLAAAQAWLYENGGEEQSCRFDIVEVLFQADGRATVNLISNAFMAGE